MEYLSSQHVLHCDLAARNVLLTKDLTAKISDFGLSKILQEDANYYRRSSDTKAAIPLFWCAPEWITYQRFTTKCDIWSFGIVLWEIASWVHDSKWIWTCLACRPVILFFSDTKKTFKFYSVLLWSKNMLCKKAEFFMPRLGQEVYQEYYYY